MRGLRPAGTEVVAIAIWRDVAAFDRLGNSGVGLGAESASEWVLEPRLETYSALEENGEAL